MNRASASPCSTRAGNASAAARRARRAVSSGRVEATRTALPKRRPRRTPVRRPARVRGGRRRRWRAGSGGRRRGRRRPGWRRRRHRAAGRADLARVLDGGEVGGHARAAEDVADDQVGRDGGRRLQPAPGVRAVHGDPGVRGERQVLRDQGEQTAVRLDHVLARAGPGGGDVPGQESAPPPRCRTSSGSPSPAAPSTTWASRRAYSNSRCAGSSRSTYDWGAPSTVRSQARSRSTSGIRRAVPWSTSRTTGMCSFTPPL